MMMTMFCGPIAPRVERSAQLFGGIAEDADRVLAAKAPKPVVAQAIREHAAA